MIEVLEKFSPFTLTIFGTLFTYGVTALGGAMVFFFKKINKKVLDCLMGFAGGVMIAASFWSLLSPAIELSSELGYIEWVFPAIGFFIGGIFIVVASIFLDKTYKKYENGSSKKRNALLFGAITLHNIPEGLSVGVAFGALAQGVPGCDLVGGVLLAIGIGLQNFPEGASVSLPMRRDGMSRGKAFFMGQLSGLVEPIAGLLGFWLASTMRMILPFALSFSAGAMISVVASELIPEASKENNNLQVIGVVIGFIVMMVMDVALG